MTRKELRNEVKKFAQNELILKVKITDKIKGKEIIFTKNGIKEAINQSHKFYDEKNKAIFNIVKLIKKSRYIKFAKDDKDNPMIKCFHYLEIEIKNEKSYIVIRELVDKTCQFYSIVDKCK